MTRWSESILPTTARRRSPWSAGRAPWSGTSTAALPRPARRASPSTPSGTPTRRSSRRCRPRSRRSAHTSNLVANEPSLRLAERLLALAGRRRPGLLRQLGRRGQRGRLQDRAAHRAPVGGAPPRAPSTAARWARSPSPGSRPSARRSSRCRAASRSCRTATSRRCGRRWTTGRPRCSSSRSWARAASSRPRRATCEAARQMTRQHGALLVLDEVQTGIGRTGAWFAHQRRRASSPTSSPWPRGSAAASRSAPARLRGRRGPARARRARHDLRRQPGVLRRGPRGARHDRGRGPARAGRAARGGARRRHHRGSVTRWSRTVRGSGLMLGVVLSEPVAPAVESAARRARVPRQRGRGRRRPAGAAAGADRRRRRSRSSPPCRRCSTPRRPPSARPRGRGHDPARHHADRAAPAHRRAARAPRRVRSQTRARRAARRRRRRRSPRPRCPATSTSSAR